ncbi:MAG: hypothetical protein R3228_12390 [Halioglobus sp.]|nr:hypothetical protein [Halioglobus sp.]
MKMNNHCSVSGLVYRGLALAGAVNLCLLPSTALAAGSALSDQPRPMQIDSVPERVRPILEIGDTFLGAGNISPGITLPTGAVWQPNLIVWGELRTSIDYIDLEYDASGDDESSAWAYRADLYGQLSLSQTDRIVVGVRNFSDDSVAEEGGFPGRIFDPDSTSNEGEFDVSLAFMELNLAELFPRVRTSGQRRALDLDLAFGRQLVFAQEGMIANDFMDSVALSRNNISIPGGNTTRVSLFYAWNEVNRVNNQEDDDAQFFGLFTETDFPKSTVSLDIVGIEGDDTEDGIWLGLSAVQRIGKINTAFRLVHSEPLDDDGPFTTDGTLLVSEVNWQPVKTLDNVYVNVFWGIDDYQPASRGDLTGNALGLVGISFAGVGLGGYGAALDSDAIESFGGAIGYQKFFANNRRQVIVELGGRESTDDLERAQAAIAARFQQAIGNRFVLRLDGFLVKREDLNEGWGARTELQVKF